MSRVAIQGIKGSYSEEAKDRLAGRNAELVECKDFRSTFEALRIGKADLAVVPVSNKIVGEIKQPADEIRSGSFKVLDQLPLRVDHVLLGTPNADIRELDTVCSHVEALKQCRKFLDSHPDWSQIICADTAAGVRRVVKGKDRRNAAIGSRRAAEIYGAKILAEHIADDVDNWTTFYLIGTQE